MGLNNEGGIKKKKKAQWELLYEEACIVWGERKTKKSYLKYNKQSKHKSLTE